MQASHVPLVVSFILAVGLATVILALSAVLGPKRPTAIKQEPFECGNPVSGPVTERFHVKYYLVAILFLAFDVEAVFVYPWALLFGDSVRNNRADVAFLALEMLGFVAMLLVGLTYVWRKGALSWNKDAS